MSLRTNPAAPTAPGAAARAASPHPQGATPQATPRRFRADDFLGRLPIPQKLLLIAVSFTLPVAAVLALLINQQNSRLEFSAGELRGVEYLVPLAGILKNTQLHRGRSIQQLTGSLPREERLGVAAEVSGYLAALSALDARYGAELGTSELLAGLEAGWAALQEDVDQLPPPEALRRHNELLREYVSPLFYSVGNNAGLLLDPDLASYYTIDLLINRLPSGSEDIGAIRALGTAAAARQTSTPAQKAELSVRLGSAREALSDINRSVGFAAAASPLVAERLAPKAEEANRLISAMFAAVEENILEPDTATLSVPEYADFAFASQLAQDSLFDDALGVVTGLLQERVQTLQRRQLIQLIVIALTLALTFALVGVVVRRITGPVSSLFRASERLSKGDLGVVVPVESSDELGALTKNFNAATARLREASERDNAELERSKTLQRNVGEFLQVAMDIADGDFTKRGQVSEDALGNVVDAINLMVEELSYLLTQTRDAALSVNQGSSEMADITDAVTKSARQQAEEAQGARERALAVTASIRRMAENADAAARASVQTLQASAQGEEAVANTLKGMASIRNEVQAIAERSESLRSRSDEISEVVKAMSHIASQINLLALNAALEAAGAGEAGARFATVAAEVQTLADEAAAAAQQVGALVRNIQTEIKEVSQSVRGGSQEVEVGYKVATEAGERLREIAQIATQSAQLVRLMSAATQEQVSGVEGVSSSIISIAQLSDQAQGRVREGRDAAARLQALSNELTENLSRFRLA